MKQIEQEYNSGLKKSTSAPSKAKFSIPEITETVEKIEEEVQDQEETAILGLLLAAVFEGMSKAKAAEDRLAREMQEIHQEKSGGLSSCGCF